MTARRQAAEAKRAMTPEQRAEAQRIEGMLSARRMLVPDARTEAEFQAGQPATYPIVIRAPNGMFVALQDAQGRQPRFRGDIEAAPAPIQSAAETERGIRLEAEASRAASDARNARRWRRQDAQR